MWSGVEQSTLDYLEGSGCSHVARLVLSHLCHPHYGWCVCLPARESMRRDNVGSREEGYRGRGSSLSVPVLSALMWFEGKQVSGKR